MNSSTSETVNLRSTVDVCAQRSWALSRILADASSSRASSVAARPGVEAQCAMREASCPRDGASVSVLVLSHSRGTSRQVHGERLVKRPRLARGIDWERVPRPVVDLSDGVDKAIWAQPSDQSVSGLASGVAPDRGGRSGATGLLQWVVDQLRQSQHDRRDHPCRSAQLCRRQP
jgi:hypothetical protein